MGCITSRDNPTVKLFRGLCSDRRERRKTGLFAAEGLRLCRDILHSGTAIVTLLSTSQAQERWPEDLAALQDAADTSLTISPELAGHISDTRTPQGVFCICRIPSEPVFEPSCQGRYLLLDGLQDPGNLGTIIRGAEAFGITAVILAGCPDLYAPKVLRSTMGSAFRQPVFRTEVLPALIARLRTAGIPVWAAALDRDAITPRELPEEGGMALVVGNEGNGVSPQVQKACTGKVYIPMSPHIESLNAAAAATVLMWEMGGRGKSVP